MVAVRLCGFFWVGYLLTCGILICCLGLVCFGFACGLVCSLLFCVT